MSDHEWPRVTMSDHEWPQMTTSDNELGDIKNISDAIMRRKFKVTVRLFHQIITNTPNLADNTMFLHANYETFSICESEEIK